MNPMKQAHLRELVELRAQMHLLHRRELELQAVLATIDSMEQQAAQIDEIARARARQSPPPSPPAAPPPSGDDAWGSAP